jgi:4-hydroxy-4-methyl-2-oxoglutarate aldolase
LIKDPPILTIRRNFPRPPMDVVDAFRGLPTGYVVDALNGRGALNHDIRPLIAANASLVGIAVTCHAGPADNLAVFGALEIIERGDVIVASTDRFTGTSVAGDLLLGMARNKGAAGFVTDGLVRDLPGLEAVGLPVYCAGVTPNSPVRNGPGTVGMPIVVGGVSVDAGDIMVADQDGVVVVPRDMAHIVLERLPAIKRAEADMEASVKGGLAMPDFIRSILDSDRTRYID